VGGGGPRLIAEQHLLPVKLALQAAQDPERFEHIQRDGPRGQILPGLAGRLGLHGRCPGGEVVDGPGLALPQELGVVFEEDLGGVRGEFVESWNPDFLAARHAFPGMPEEIGGNLHLLPADAVDTQFRDLTVLHEDLQTCHALAL